MKLGVVGSRTFNDYPYMKRLLDDLLRSYWVWKCTIVSGGALGADSLAIDYAKEEGHDWKVFPAKWRVNGIYDRSAGYKRNVEIVDYSDMIVAFWDGQSKGTKHTIDLAMKQGKPTYIFTDWNLHGTVSQSRDTIKTN